MPANHHTQTALVYLRDIFTDDSMVALVAHGLRWWGWKAEGWVTKASPTERDQILRILGRYSLSARR